MVGVIAHWLDEDLRKQEVLIGLKQLKGPHSGENIAAVTIPLLEWYDLAPQLGFFIGDDDGTNDTAIRVILKHLRPEITKTLTAEECDLGVDPRPE